MPRIKFQELVPVEGTRKDGSVWTGTKVKGIKYEDGSEWVSGTMFDSDKTFSDAIEELRSTEQGTPVNVKHTQKPGSRFWDITGIVIGDAEVMADAPANPRVGKSAGTVRGTSTNGSGGSNSMSKEEWAAKDAKKSAEIAKSVALKAAVDNTAVDTEATSIIELAEIFEDYLLGRVDPLAPPKEV
jgi:hypothetical protein